MYNIKYYLSGKEVSKAKFFASFSKSREDRMERVKSEKEVHDSSLDLTSFWNERINLRGLGGNKS